MNGLRCRPGDLAVVVGPGVQTPGLVGRFVIVEELAPNSEFFLDGVNYKSDTIPGWIVRSAATGSKLPVLRGTVSVAQVMRRPIADSVLRPIRPNEGEDETLSWSRPRTDELELSEGGALVA